MATFDNDKFKAVQKSNLDMLAKLNDKMLDTVEKLAQLQLKALRSATGESLKTFQKALNVRDSQSFTEFQNTLAQMPMQSNAWMEVNREVYDVISKTQAEVSKLAEGQLKKSSQEFQGLMESVVKNAPGGAEPMIAAWKTAVEAANNIYENAQKAVKQASSLMENGVSAAASAAAQATGAAASKGSKK